MQTVQIAITTAPYAAALGDALERAGAWRVTSVEIPDVDQEGVLVLDRVALNRLPLPLPHPERVVLIASNDPEELSRAWQAGIMSVIFDSDSLNTAMLAIMSAAFRVPQKGAGEDPASDPGEADRHGSTSQGRSGNRCCRSRSNVIYEADNGNCSDKGPQRGGGAT